MLQAITRSTVPPGPVTVPCTFQSTMELLRVDPRSPDPAIVARAAGVLRDGGLVAFPTETVYGLGANALDPNAVERIYSAEGRPAYNPLIVHIADASDAPLIAAEWPERAEMLARAFWPGPLTIVLPKKPNVPDGVTAGLPSVAIRVPAHPVARALLAAARIPVAAPSANRSMMLSPTTAAHVAKSLGDSVDLILDGGPTNVGIESTVIDLTTPTPTLLRPGMISAEAIGRIIGPIGAARTRRGRRRSAVARNARPPLLATRATVARSREGSGIDRLVRAGGRTDGWRAGRQRVSRRREHVEDAVHGGGVREPVVRIAPRTGRRGLRRDRRGAGAGRRRMGGVRDRLERAAQTRIAPVELRRDLVGSISSPERLESGEHERPGRMLSTFGNVCRTTLIEILVTGSSA